MSKNLKVMTGPTGTIWVGASSKPNQFTGIKKDVTDECYSAVAHSILITDQAMQFEYEGETYILGVDKVNKGVH